MTGGAESTGGTYVDCPCAELPEMPAVTIVAATDVMQMPRVEQNGAAPVQSNSPSPQSVVMYTVRVTVALEE